MHEAFDLWQSSSADGELRLKWVDVVKKVGYCQ